MYLLILKVLVYYQLLRGSQDSHRDAQKAHDTLLNWYYSAKKPQFQQQEKTIEDLKMTISTLTKELDTLKSEIAEMQARAIFEAVVEATAKTGTAPIPEVMIPLIAGRAEYDLVAAIISTVHGEVEAQSGQKIEYLCGTMIELPRACLKADDIAGAAEFFSFGTNDLTQTAFGISRDDSARFMNDYITKGIWERDPFVSIDVEGVGELVRIGVERGRSVRPDIKLGICGEHGGDPHSVHFCHELGLDYVSCSPYRVPVARLAAAQAAVQ